MEKTGTSLNDRIYSARLIFKKSKKDKISNVSINIRYAKKGKRKKEKRAFPENLNKEELSWTRYHGETLAVYHRLERRGHYSYFDFRSIVAPTNLAQKLEDLVQEVHLRDRALPIPSNAYFEESS
ncbi:hypothetical protein FJZ20_00355 [Candidatus Pacearchaeota archaeon]|nr:hypothetical protein [Candidatus Pacearchaeota archaeon]